MNRTIASVTKNIRRKTYLPQSPTQARYVGLRYLTPNFRKTYSGKSAVANDVASQEVNEATP